MHACLAHPELASAYLSATTCQTWTQSDMAKKADIWDAFREGNTALHLACQSNQLKVIEVLLQWGARANMTNASGFAPVSTTSPSSLCVAYAPT